MQSKLIFGIDLGTTNSCICVWENNTAKVLTDEFGNRTIPSYVSFTNVSKYVGADAKNQKDLNCENVFYEVKRIIGRMYGDKCVSDFLRLLSYNIIPNENGGINIKSTIRGGKIFSVEEISAFVLRKLKTMACTYIKNTYNCEEPEIIDVVITVPAHFTDGQRQATFDAAQIAGLNCIRIINEPTAAALAYGISERKNNNDVTLLVFDFGGGTLDCSVMNICDGTYEVIGSSGNSYFGGADFDNRLMAYCMTSFAKTNYNNANLFKLNNNWISTDGNMISKLSLQRLRIQCENAKKMLSASNYAYVNVDKFYDDKNMSIKITRELFDKICADLYAVGIHCVNNILRECRIRPDDIDEVILVGGMTRVPTIRQLLTDLFRNSEKNKINCSINPDEAVAIGAAIQGYIIANKCSSDIFSDSIMLLDSTPLSLGIELHGGIMDIIIKRNSQIPCEESRMYSTDEDNMSSIVINVYEGERSLVAHNIKVGTFELTNLPLRPKGQPEIEITFKIDANGIVSVCAHDKESGAINELTITTNKNRLTAEQIKNMIDDANEFDAYDRINKAKRLFYCEIEDLCKTIIKNLATSNMDETKKTSIKYKIDNISEWLEHSICDNVTIEQYEEMINIINTDYGGLLYKSRLDEIAGCKELDSSFQSSLRNGLGDELNATTIYGQSSSDDDMKQQYEKIEDNDVVVEQNNTMVLKNKLASYCDNIMGYLYTLSLGKADKYSHEEERTNYIANVVDDVMLWLYSHDNPTEDELNDKIFQIELLMNENKQNVKLLCADETVYKENINQSQTNGTSVIDLIRNKQNDDLF